LYAKSTLLLGLIGELENYEGKIDVKGKIAYISQQPWIFTASIKQNILFGNEFNKEKFDKVVEVCSLKKVYIIHFNNLSRFEIDSSILLSILIIFYKIINIIKYFRKKKVK